MHRLQAALDYYYCSTRVGVIEPDWYQVFKSPVFGDLKIRLIRWYFFLSDKQNIHIFFMCSYFTATSRSARLCSDQLVVTILQGALWWPNYVTWTLVTWLMGISPVSSSLLKNVHLSAVINNGYRYIAKKLILVLEFILRTFWVSSSKL